MTGARLAAAGALATLAAAPLLLGPYAVGSLSRILAFALLAASLGLLVGLAALPSLGHAAYFGVGAYAAALIGLHVTPVALVQLAGALLAAGAVAGLTGIVAVRASGTYFLMLTLAIGAMAHELADTWTAVTGGSNGLAAIPAIRLVPGGDPLTAAGLVYWYVLACCAALYAGLRWVARSPFGRELAGIGDNEARMRALGCATARVKRRAFCLSGAIAGAAGSLWVAQARFVSPADLHFEVGVLALLAVVVGGAGTLWGPCLGAAAVLAVRDHVGPAIGGRGPAVLGLAFIAAVYLLPRRRR